MKSFVVIYCSAVIIAQSVCLASDSVSSWTHVMTLDHGVEVKWEATDPYFLTMEISAPTRGYVGIGFSPSGGMVGSDIAIGWVDSRGTPHLRDYHALDQGMPIQDVQQDYELIAAEEKGIQTTVRFRRRWETCDEKNDMTIGNDTMRLIWAWHPEDPQMNSKVPFQWHGTKNRGVRSVYMRSPARPKEFPDDLRPSNPHVKYWDLKMSNVHVSSKDNSYICRIVRFPHLNSKHHMIGFRPLITNGNEEYVHHMSLYHCQVPDHLGGTGAVFDKYFNRESRECYSPNMPSEWSKHCFTFLFTWAVGSEGEMLPDHVGSALGGKDASYFKLEIHYSNPVHRTFTDSSGIRVFYTDHIRQYDATTLFIGHRTTPFQLIPPGVEEFSSYGFCPSECTRKGINPLTGIRAVSVMLHAHLSGRKIRLRHIRKGKELPPIAEDNHYDFNYQQFRILSSEVPILAGDELLVECEYNTSHRNQFVLGGPDAEQEMCQAVLFYYPKSDLTDCRTQPEMFSFFKALGIDNVTGDILHPMGLPWTEDPDEYDNVGLVPPDNAYQLLGGRYATVENPFDLIRITKPDRLRNMSVDDFLRQKNWKSKSVARRIEKGWKNGMHYMFCAGPGQRKVYTRDRATSYPKFRAQRDEGKSSCRGGRKPQKISSSHLSLHEHEYSDYEDSSAKTLAQQTFITLIAVALMLQL